MTEFDKYEDEARKKWGETPEYREYTEKTKDCTKDEKSSVAIKLDDIMAKFATCKKSGNSPDSSETQSLVEELRNHITTNYYRCSPEMLASLGQMYVLDERFRKSIDKHGEGTADFIRQATEFYFIKITGQLAE